MKLRLTLLCAALLLTGCKAPDKQGVASEPGQSPILPDPNLSPGDVLTSDPAVICQRGYTQTVRNVPQALKEQVYREYGITHREKGEYEIDHLISLELGGSNSVRNLWPESYRTQPLNAHVKDDLENKLHALACAGKATFPEVQRAIAANWEEAYVKYIGPLPGGVRPAAEAPAATPAPTQAPPPADTSSSDVQGASQAESPASGPSSGTAGEPVEPGANGTCPPSAPVKVSRSDIYHLPTGDPSYAATHAVACFPDAASAQAAGHRAPIR